MTIADLYEDTITLPRAVRWPVELLPPEGFDPGVHESWPRLSGRLEVGGAEEDEALLLDKAR